MSGKKGNGEIVKNYAVGAVIGGVIGVVSALLLAPKSGRELRSGISGQYRNISEKTQAAAGEVGQKSKAIAGTVSSHTTEWVGKAKEAVGQIADEVKAWKASAKKDAPGSQEAQIGSAAEEVAAALEENREHQEK
jgi:gas vesicle protein